MLKTFHKWVGLSGSWKLATQIHSEVADLCSRPSEDIEEVLSQVAFASVSRYLDPDTQTVSSNIMFADDSERSWISTLRSNKILLTQEQNSQDFAKQSRQGDEEVASTVEDESTAEAEAKRGRIGKDGKREVSEFS